MNRANMIRQDVIKMIAQKEAGNASGNLSVAEILTALYFIVLKHNPRQPRWEERDRVYIANQLSPAWHATLAHAGYFTKKALLQPTKELPKGTEPGQGLSIAVGSALAARMNSKIHHTYCILGETEQHHGRFWEAVMLAGKYKLNNLILIIDRNNTQADGYTEELVQLEPLQTKYEAFGWNVIEVDGHNISHITEALNEAKTVMAKPIVILAHTIPGKGVSFIENNYEWHSKVPSEEEVKEALAELRK